MERKIPTLLEYRELTTKRSNWGRWGSNDQRGAINLITPETRVAAARLVKSGRTVSLSRPFPSVPGPGNKNPAVHLLKLWGDDREGGVEDYIGIAFHGQASTHLDAIGHGWQSQGAWNGKTPKEAVTFGAGFPAEPAGLAWGSVDQMGDGVFTRGVLLDVPRFRGEAFVRQDKPVHGWELEDIAKAQGVKVGAGDALVVYSGREKWNEVNPSWGTDPVARPGLHASCLEFFKNVDCAMVVWDMMDLRPSGYEGIQFATHAALSSLGLPLLDNALLEPLAAVCQSEKRYEFLLVVAPLRIVGGTGSPINPIAVF